MERVQRECGDVPSQHHLEVEGLDVRPPSLSALAR